MEILYQDSAVVVVVKPVGVLSEDAPACSVPALLAPLVGPVLAVHRLDRAVGGVMVYARTKKAAAALSRAVAEHRLVKHYEAVLCGQPQESEGELRDHLFRDTRLSKAFVAKSARRGTKEAVLGFRTKATAVLEGALLSRVSVKLVTGRFHQIRVQFASRGLPLVGDGKYGARIKAPSVALFAASLTFPHPDDGREMTFSAPVPAEFPWTLFGRSQYEIEHKYLIAYPDIAALEQVTGCRRLMMVQTYLTSAAGETHRVREVREGDRVTFIETRKRRISALSATEEEREITKEEYRALLLRAEAGSTPIQKTRYVIPLGARVAEIDLYPFWQDRAILEVEVESEQETVELPPYLRVLKEVSADKRYKNVNLARSVPFDDISTEK